MRAKRRILVAMSLVTSLIMLDSNIVLNCQLGLPVCRKPADEIARVLKGPGWTLDDRTGRRR
jgi:hypothetical protein